MGSPNPDTFTSVPAAIPEDIIDPTEVAESETPVTTPVPANAAVQEGE